MKERLTGVALLTLLVGVAIAADILLVEDAATNVRMVVTDSGTVGMGTATPDANAALDVVSTSKAFIPPRLTTAQRDAIAPATAGMQIYNTDTHTLDFYDAGQAAWISLGAFPPIFSSAAVLTVTLDINYTSDNGLDLTSTPAVGDFSIGNSGLAQSVLGVVVAANKVTLTLLPGVVNGDTVTVSYTPGVNKIKDATTGRPAAALVNKPVTNNSPTIDKTGGVAYYKFDEAAGNLINQATVANGWPDGLGAAADGTPNGNPTYTQPGKIGTAISFDGSGDFFDVGPSLSQFKFAHDGTSDWSVAFWLKMNVIDPGTLQGIVGTGEGGTTQGFTIAFHDNSVDHKLRGRIEAGGLGTTILSSDLYIPKSTTEWHHYIVTYEAGTDTWSIYKDNANFETNTQILMNGTADHDKTLKVGSVASGGFTDLNGVIDELVIFKRIFTAQERADLYGNGTGLGL